MRLADATKLTNCQAWWGLWVTGNLLNCWGLGTGVAILERSRIEYPPHGATMRIKWNNVCTTFSTSPGTQQVINRDYYFCYWAGTRSGWGEGYYIILRNGWSR